MKSFIRYPGGKYKFKKIIVSELYQFKDYDEYREPFFGGGSIGLHMIESLHSKRFWINDYDIGIACLWRAVARLHDELKERVRTYKPTVADFHTFKQFFLGSPQPVTDQDVVETGFRKLALHQISYSGLGVMSGGPLGGAVQDENTRYPIDCRWSGKSICTKIDAIHPHLATARISNGDFLDLIVDQQSRALLYLDPPYFDKGGELYQHSFTEADHIRLRDALIATPHDWVLSYDNVPAVRAMYDDAASVVEIDANYTINTSTKKTELLIFKKDHESIMARAVAFADQLGVK